MAEQLPQQNFENHVRRHVPFGITALVLLATIIGAGINLYLSIGDHERLYNASLIFVLSVIVLMIGFFARTYATKVQDRAIHAEENLRHFVLTGKLLDPRLSHAQIVAARFASDDQFVDLIKQAADQNLAPVDIKKAVKNWRADHHRV